jgi:hypothetical protein
MNRRGPVPLKGICLWFIVVILSAGVSFVIFLALLSIKIGFKNSDQDGFIIPILAGIISIAVCLFLFICIMKFIFSTMKQKDILKSSR